MRQQLRSSAELITERFADSSYIALRGLHVDEHGDMIVIRGELRNHHLKQIARAIADGIAPGKKIHFHIDVRGREPMTSGGSKPKARLGSLCRGENKLERIGSDDTRPIESAIMV